MDNRPALLHDRRGRGTGLERPAARKLFGSSDKQTEQPAPEPAPKHLTAQQLVGTWVYAGAVIRYTGEDLLASMAVGVLEGQIEEYCAKAGVVAGRDRVTLDRRGTAGGGRLVRIDKHEAEGLPLRPPPRARSASRSTSAASGAP